MKTPFLAAAILLLLAGPARAAPVRIGVILPRTGPEAPIGEEMANGIKLAQEDLKKSGLDVELVWEDDTGKPQIAMSAMERLATRERVSGVVGSYTSASTSAVARIAEKYKVPLLVPISSKDEITMQGQRWTFRINSPASFYVQALLDLVHTVGHPRSAALIYEDTDFGNSAARSFKAAASKQGIAVLYEAPYSKGSPDYRSTLTRVRALKPDLIFMVSYIADAILLMRQAQEIGVQPQAFLGAGGGFNLAQFAADRSISNHVITSTQWSEDVRWPGAAEFARRYKERFGLDSSHHGACSYESVRILAETAVRAQGDRERTRAGLRAGKWSGLLGDVRFEDFAGFTNQNHHPILVQQIFDGRYELVYPASVANRKPVFPYPGPK
ncbi:MAG TPA: ABC transporter substrate-binding protein [Anaeromyxobacteraceae bacterium]|jgi:branched-chain amino acid transport system substrate-binding protein|nr:ABC transporter substrate-binding protein [Anaeromyxobacteraceae bacterium]